MKNKILLIMSILGLVTTGLVIWKFYNRSSLQPSRIKIWESYYQKKCLQAANAIKEAFAIPDAKFKEIFKQIAFLKAHDPLWYNGPITSKPNQNKLHPLAVKARLLLAENGLNPDAVEIVFGNDPESSASAIQDYYQKEDCIVTSIEINPDLMSKKPADAQEGILRHEIVHLINYDSIEEGYIKAVLEEMGHTEKDWNNHPTMIAYRHLKELRADQLAGIYGGLKTANALKKDMTKYCHFGATCSHPAPCKRVAHLNVVVSYLENANRPGSQQSQLT